MSFKRTRKHRKKPNTAQWQILRQLEDRACKKYEHCLRDAALKDRTYVPCYECMGGVPMCQFFTCLECQTMWRVDDNDWIATCRVQCPFCRTTYIVMLSMKDGKPYGALLPHGSKTGQLG